MIAYKPTIGMCAGIALVLLSHLLGRVSGVGGDTSREFDRRLWGASLAVLGLLLAILGGLLATVESAAASPSLDRLIGESSLLLGALQLAAALYLWHHPGPVTDFTRADLTPPAVAAFAAGIMLIAFAAGILQYGVIDGTPPLEPILGLPYPYYTPRLENAVLALIYGSVGVGALLAPITRLAAGRLLRLVRALWFSSGVTLAAISATNCYVLAAMAWNGIHASRYI